MDWPPTSADSQSLGNGPTPLSYGLKEKKGENVYFMTKSGLGYDNEAKTFLQYLCNVN